jgi:polyhydroxyalkanoate synthesis regulator phasin
MRKLSLALFIAALSLASCKSADNNAGAIASDFCECFRDIEKDMSSDTKRIVAKATEANNPTKSLQDDIVAMGEEKGQQIAQEMARMGELEDENSKVGRCIKDVEKKYKNAYSLNEEKTVRKILAELENKSGCSFTASLMKIGLKVKENPGMQ